MAAPPPSASASAPNAGTRLDQEQEPTCEAGARRCSLKGYSLVELKRYAEARPVLEAAIQLSPDNSQYLSVLGNLLLKQRDWDKAMQAFQSAETAAQFTEPHGGQAGPAR
ncbi:MAG TPA: tetratricopeptide repeat protein [Ramlibacter sp.]|nr:tetratricopeptide repeat protein [Ramlibacter sp.]